MGINIKLITNRIWETLARCRLMLRSSPFRPSIRDGSKDGQRSSSSLGIRRPSKYYVLMKDDGSDSVDEGILSDCLSDTLEPINSENHNAEFFDFVKSEQDEVHHLDCRRYNFRPRAEHQNIAESPIRAVRSRYSQVDLSSGEDEEAAQTPDHLIRFRMVRDQPRRRTSRRVQTSFLKRVDVEEDGTFYIPKSNARLPAEPRRSRRPHRDICYNEKSLFSAEFSDPEPENKRPYSNSPTKTGALGDDSPKHATPSNQYHQSAGEAASSLPLTERIAGMDEYLRKLKEMIVFPLLYPEVFNRLGISPPRGVLFHGPPGTGKTLLARLLADSCSIAGSGRKVAFFMKNGSDCLSKWIGEAEKNLRKLFHKAREQQPAIIFFDEIDGLAPERTGKQDQSHISLVATLLALLDGLDDRGNVVVIGATNRINALDPALRRPGRFDREFYFGLPDQKVRREILRIQTCAWQPAIDSKLLDRLAVETVDYSGADIKALCVEAALGAVRRICPRAYDLTLPPPTVDDVISAASGLTVSEEDFLRAFAAVTPSSRRQASVSMSKSKPLKALFEDVVEGIVGEINSRCYQDSSESWAERGSACFTEPIISFDINFQLSLSIDHLRLVSSMVASRLKGSNVTRIDFTDIADPKRVLSRLPAKGGVVLLTGLRRLLTGEGSDGDLLDLEIRKLFFVGSPYLLVLIDSDPEGSLDVEWFRAFQVDWDIACCHLQVAQDSLEKYVFRSLHALGGPTECFESFKVVISGLRAGSLSKLEIEIAKVKQKISESNAGHSDGDSLDIREFGPRQDLLESLVARVLNVEMLIPDTVASQNKP